MSARTSAREEHSKRLNRGIIVKAGLDLAARTQTDAISVRALGSELGVDPTAVYRHFKSKDDLMRALLDELQGTALRQVPPDAAWRERLRLLAWATLDTFVDHPAIAMEAALLTTNGPAEMATIEFILAAFAEAGLEGTRLVHYYALFASYVLSEVAGIARGRTGARDVDAEVDAWFDGPLLVDPVKHSHIAAVATELHRLRDRDIFRLGVDLILDSALRTTPASVVGGHDQ